MEEQDSSKFVVKVSYIQPEFAELYYRFPSEVNKYFNKVNPMDPIEICKDVSRESRELTFEYVHMHRAVWTKDVLAVMDSKGLRPALYEELLCFAEEYPDRQKKNMIIALGSVMYLDGSRYVACLDQDGYGRMLCLYYYDGGAWGNICRFLAVRK